MAIATEQATEIETLDVLLRRIGSVPLDRIRVRPPVGTATEDDVLGAKHQSGRSCELIEGVLVEKAMGFLESYLAIQLAMLLTPFIEERRLGIVTGEGGMMRLFPGLVRIPDVAFVSWDRLPERRVPRKPVPDLAPNLVIEVLSQSNTRAEMELKRRNYLDAGVQLVWYFEPKWRTVKVIRKDRDDLLLGEADVLDGEDVLPGFSVNLGALFDTLDRFED